MRELNNYILEKLKINKDSTDKSKYVIIVSYDEDLSDRLYDFEPVRINFGGIKRDQEDWWNGVIVPFEEYKDYYEGGDHADYFLCPPELTTIEDIQTALENCDYCADDLKKINEY